MDILRTPDSRFADLPDYPFAPHYQEVAGLRIHYVDEGPAEVPPVLLLHGEPTWSYLYRKVIPVLVDAGHRVIAPDLIGFGRSDKPTDRADYTYQNHVDWTHGFIAALDLHDITVVGHDWGGFIGLRLACEHEDRFARIVAAHTALPTGDRPPSDGFLRWRRYSQDVPDFRAGDIVRQGTVTTVPDEVRAAYDAPFPDPAYQAGARQFPLLVPISPHDPASEANRAAWQVLRRWHKPFLTVFSGEDQSFDGADKVFQDTVPGAADQPHTVIPAASHFLPEDGGPELARILFEFLA